MDGHDRRRFLCIAQTPSGVTEHLDPHDRPKLVRYWVMSRLTGTCVPNDEGDAIASLRPAEALVRLSHTRDRDLLARSVELLADALEARESVDARSLG